MTQVDNVIKAWLHDYMKFLYTDQSPASKALTLFCHDVEWKSVSLGCFLFRVSYSTVASVN